jgi:hypothetical protein
MLLPSAVLLYEVKKPVRLFRISINAELTAIVVSHVENLQLPRN